MRALILGFCLIGIAYGSHAGSVRRKQREPDPILTCKTINRQCAICSDGKLRAPGDVNQKNHLSVSAWECVQLGKSAAERERLKGSKSCVPLSGFCAVCPGDTFVSQPQGQPLSSDIYECATKPRLFVKRGTIK